MAIKEPTTTQNITRAGGSEDKRSSEELSGAKLKTDRDSKADDQGKTVNLTGPGGTKVSAPERVADSLKAAGFK